jgi:hypothetical protein
MMVGDDSALVGNYNLGKSKKCRIPSVKLLLVGESEINSVKLLLGEIDSGGGGGWAGIFI